MITHLHYFSIAVSFKKVLRENKAMNVSSLKI